LRVPADGSRRRHAAATGTAQNQYVFWDKMHPTTAAQTVMANAAFQSLGVA
jgi:phospholipase/lecithinase/hemolysin